MPVIATEVRVTYIQSLVQSIFIAMNEYIEAKILQVQSIKEEPFDIESITTAFMIIGALSVPVLVSESPVEESGVATI